MSLIDAATALFGNGGEVQPEPLTDRIPDNQIETKCTILAIDDDSMVLQTIKSLLGKHGFNVLTSTSATKGLDMLRYVSGDVHLVLLDYSMPKLNGDKTLSFLKQLSPNVKIIGLTAMNPNSLPKEYRDGVDKLLTKPVISSELIAAVNEVLGEGEPTPSAIRP
jgi:CheY-like chemotaxis protein